jgi:hypothetical protein
MGRVALGHLRWFGMVVGAGLVITGSFFPLFAVFVDARILQIPAVDPSDPASFPAHFTWINQHLHYLLEVGSVMGVLTLPFWTIAVGRKLLREKASEGVPVDVRPVSTPA